MTYTTRFAPSPTGPLHLGHAFSALTAYDRANAQGGSFLLRIEDIDASRARPEWEALIYEDLAWLGINWPQPVMRQSDRLPAYRSALDHLSALGLCYPCSCTRADIRAAMSAPQEGTPLMGPDGLIYPGTCRGRSIAEASDTDSIRLNMASAVAYLGTLPGFEETGPLFAGLHSLSAETLISSVGDVVLARRDMGTSYHLSVVVDDAAQAITEVVRGADIFEATQIHVLLQALLDLPQPAFYHHDLIRNEAGKRLAKRDDARAIRLYRDQGMTLEDIRKLVGL